MSDILPRVFSKPDCREPRPPPASRVSAAASTSAFSTGSRTHPWLYASTRFAGCWCFLFPAFSTGSRTHPWLYAGTRFAGCWCFLFHLLHRFADSPVALCLHPLRGLVLLLPPSPRVRGLTRGFMPPPASRVAGASFSAFSTGSRTHPWLYASTLFRVKAPPYDKLDLPYVVRRRAW